MSALPPQLPHLAKRRPDPEGLDFEGLRAAGIELLQGMCGDVWTDYNLHDPGVTILEQLCFGLTDLVYRSRFDTEDFLFGPDGRIDGPAQALLPAEQVLPCRPLTAEDYTRLFADAIAELRNVWVEADDKAPFPGIYRIHVRIAENAQATPGLERDVLERIAALYQANRNLCEDLGALEIVAEETYQLCGRIEIERGGIAADILAEIYFACKAAISPPIPQQPYHSLTQIDLDQVFEGPLSRHGFIDAQALRGWSGATLSQLVGIVAGVAGVVRVDSLQLFDGTGGSCEAATGDRAARRVPSLTVPRRAEDLAIRLHSAGHLRRVAIDEFLARLQQLEFEAASRRHATVASESVSPLPTGSPPSFDAYTSVQQHFPPNYGLGRHGVPESASLARKAQAKQLKAYLLLFDQIMANGMQGLQGVRRLYSLDGELEHSYFHQVLGQHQVPGAEALYTGDLDGLDARLRDILAQLDGFGDRRGRILDYLLALHGERFSQHFLRAFAAQQGSDPQAELLRNKLAFLRETSHLNADRMGAGKPGADALGEVSSFARKLGLLLDLDGVPARSLTIAIRERGLQVLGDKEFREHASLQFVDTLAGSEAAVALPETGGLSQAEPDSSVSFLQCKLVCPALLSGGGDPARYQIVAAGSITRLYFAMSGQDGYCLLSAHADRGAAVVAANRLMRFFHALVDACAGFHLVEHIRLRPAAEPGGPAVDAAFYPFRMTALFPEWPPRLSDPGFRKLVAETAYMCSPAHIRTDILWLGFDDMTRFEQIYGQWGQLKADPAAPHPEVAKAAHLLTLFLKSQGSRVYGTRWV